MTIGNAGRERYKDDRSREEAQRLRKPPSAGVSPPLRRPPKAGTSATQGESSATQGEDTGHPAPTNHKKPSSTTTQPSLIPPVEAEVEVIDLYREAVVALVGVPTRRQGKLMADLMVLACQHPVAEIGLRAERYLRAFTVPLTLRGFYNQWEWLGSVAAQAAAVPERDKKQALKTPNYRKE